MDGVTSSFVAHCCAEQEKVNKREADAARRLEQEAKSAGASGSAGAGMAVLAAEDAGVYAMGDRGTAGGGSVIDSPYY